MRIAVYHNLPSGGAKRATYEQVRRLVRKHHVDVFSLSCADHAFADLRPHTASHQEYPFQPLPLCSSPFGRLNQAIRLADLARLRGLTRRVANRIDGGDYDVVLVQPCQFESSPSLLSHLQGNKSTYYCHEPPRHIYEVSPARPYNGSDAPNRRLLNLVDPLPGVYRMVLSRSDRRNLRNARMVLVNSRFVGADVDRLYGISPRVSYLGVDEQVFRPLPVQKRNMVLSVGSLTPLKAFDFLINAMRRIPEKHRPVLAIACNSQNQPERVYLEDLARTGGVCVEFFPNIPDTTLVELYNQAIAVAYAPIREPFGLVSLEAMACATPVVAVREGGIPETVLDGCTGLLVDRDEACFAEALLRLVRESRLAERLGGNGREHVLANWTWDRAILVLEAHLAEVAGKTAESRL